MEKQADLLGLLKKGFDTTGFSYCFYFLVLGTRKDGSVRSTTTYLRIMFSKHFPCFSILCFCWAPLRPESSQYKLEREKERRAGKTLKLFTVRPFYCVHTPQTTLPYILL